MSSAFCLFCSYPVLSKNGAGTYLRWTGREACPTRATLVFRFANRERRRIPGCFEKLRDLRRAGRPPEGVAVAEPPEAAPGFLGAARSQLPGEARRNVLHCRRKRLRQEHAFADGGGHSASLVRHGGYRWPGGPWSMPGAGTRRSACSGG